MAQGAARKRTRMPYADQRPLPFGGCRCPVARRRGLHFAEELAGRCRAVGRSRHAPQRGQEIRIYHHSGRGSSRCRGRQGARKPPQLQGGLDRAERLAGPRRPLQCRGQQDRAVEKEAQNILFGGVGASRKDEDQHSDGDSKPRAESAPSSSPPSSR